MPHDPSVNYSSDVTDDELARLQVTFSVTGGLDHAHWACPRCRAAFDQSFSRDQPVFKFDVDTVDAPGNQGLLDLVCHCGFKHQGGSDAGGCGFAAVLPVEAG